MTDIDVTTATHVAQWGAPWLIEGWDGGLWDLQTRSDYEAGTPGVSSDYYSSDLPRDADPAALAEWVAEEVGYPVTLVPGTQTFRLHKHWGRWHTEPVYYVFPEA